MQAFEFVLTLLVVFALGMTAILLRNKKSQADSGRILQMLVKAVFMIVKRLVLFLKASNRTPSHILSQFHALG